MNQFAKIAVLAAMATAECADKPNGDCIHAYSYACEHTAGMATDCPMSCFKHNNGPNAASLPQTCEDWAKYTPGGADCQDASPEECMDAYSYACKTQDGVARKCPASCTKNAWPQQPCDYWKNYYPGGGDGCKDDANANCSLVATAFNCENTAGVSQKCPGTCVIVAPQDNRTCEEWKKYTPAGPTVPPAPSTTTSTTSTSSTTSSSTTSSSTTSTQPPTNPPAPTDPPSPSGGVPDVPSFTMPSHGTFDMSLLVTQKNKAPSAQSAARAVNQTLGPMSMSGLRGQR